MKLRNKAFSIIGLITLTFLAITCFKTVRIPLLNYTAITLFFGAIASFCLYSFIIKRIENLSQVLTEVKETNLPLPAPLQEDELGTITTSVNTLIHNIRQSSKQEQQKLDERAQELQKENQQLQQEIIDRNYIETKVANDRIANDKDCLTRIARYDAMTTLPNRVFFNEILNKSISSAKRRQKILAVLLIDLDSFQQVTKKLGLEKSEIVLKEISRRFTNVLRSEDILAKLDGDEFIVLLNDIGQAKFASTVAEKLLNVCAHPIKVDDHDFTITASIGICVYPIDGNSLESLMKNAEHALVRTKHTGGAAYQFYTAELDVEAREYILLESALRKALHNNELTLSYQPKIHIKNGSTSGLEVLMRWEHPVIGIINPSKFIPLAEETGMIMKIGEWALREACQTNKLWQDQGYEHLSIAFKLSTKQFYHPDIIKMITTVLEKTKMNAEYLEIEIAEKTVMDNVDEAIVILNAMKNIGIQLSIDHFGTGYTSISHLKKFPISAVKIDKSFIQGVPNNPDDSAITSAIIALVHNLGLVVIGEGVETAEQVQFLSNHQCDIVQGYFLSHPLSANKIVLQFSKLRDEVLI